MKTKIIADDSLERALGGQIAGVDEAGRGPWAGPVVAAAVILPAGPAIRGLADSKTLSRARREALSDEIQARAWVGIGQASVPEIEQLNILAASLEAMRRAVENLAITPAAVLVDGNRLPELKCPARAVVRGDARSVSIAAASIVAKVFRDALMAGLAARHPGYGWERNAGYGTPEHRRGLERLGVTGHHRRLFKPIKRLLDSTLSS